MSEKESASPKADAATNNTSEVAPSVDTVTKEAAAIVDDTDAHMDAHMPLSAEGSTPTPRRPLVPSGVVVAVALGGLLLVGAAVYWFMGTTSDVSNTPTQIDFGTMNGATPVAEADIPDVVASVDGVDISKEEFLTTVAQIEAAVAAQGQDPTNQSIAAQIQEQAINQLVNNELLTQAATDAGVTATSEEVAAELGQIEAGFPSEEAFTAELANAGLTLEELENNVSLDIAVGKYFDSLDAIQNAPDVTSDDALEAYNNVAAQANGAELPPFTEVEAQITAQLSEQNRQAAIVEVVTELRDAATIELFI